MRFDNVFKNATKEELYGIFLNYQSSKEHDFHCATLTSYAKQYLNQSGIPGMMPLWEAIDIIEKMYFEEIAHRYFNQ